MSVAVLFAAAGPSMAAGFPVGGKIAEEYSQATTANGKVGNQFFGDAITPERDAARDGKYQKFYNNSSIYWHPLVSNSHANQIGGAIRDKWLEPIDNLGAEWGPLKYPTTREKATRVPGRFNHFEGGSIYWSSATGAHRIWGAIKNTWAAADWEVGQYGFPASDELECAQNTAQNASYGGFGQLFERGNIYYNASGNGNFTRGTGHSSVFDGEVLWSGQTQFSSELNQAISTWTQLGKVTFRSIVVPDPLYPDYIRVGDYDDPSSNTLGSYSFYGDGAPDSMGTELRTSFSSM